MQKNKQKSWVVNMNRIELDILYSIKKLLDDLIQKKEEEFKKEDDYNTEQMLKEENDE